MRDIDPNEAIDFIFRHSKIFAAAKAERIYLEEFRKSKKALLMKESFEETIGAQEREAYAHPDYEKLLMGLREAIEIEEKLRWELVAAQARVDVWRSIEASNRQEARALG
jgi:hypothetical protein